MSEGDDDVVLMRGKKSKALKVNLNEEERKKVVFENCRDCTIEIGFEFTTGDDVTKEYEKWFKLPKRERPAQQIIFKNCEGMTIVEKLSVDIIVVFVDCKACTGEFQNCDGAIDIIKCTDMEITSLLAKQIRLFFNERLLLNCSDECDVVVVDNKVDPAINRRFIVQDVISSGANYRRAKAVIRMQHGSANGYA
eukprot:m.21211 g.21211  ORF g.21211 m.21211 type:complete len:194 (+) comp5332_c0_seq2:269-850(+)